MMAKLLSFVKRMWNSLSQENVAIRMERDLDYYHRIEGINRPVVSIREKKYKRKHR